MDEIGGGEGGKKKERVRFMFSSARTLSTLISEAQESISFKIHITRAPHKMSISKLLYSVVFNGLRYIRCTASY